jgi:hypothetical protein
VDVLAEGTIAVANHVHAGMHAARVLRYDNEAKKFAYTSVAAAAAIVQITQVRTGNSCGRRVVVCQYHAYQMHVLGV